MVDSCHTKASCLAAAVGSCNSGCPDSSSSYRIGPNRGWVCRRHIKSMCAGITRSLLDSVNESPTSKRGWMLKQQKASSRVKTNVVAHQEMKHTQANQIYVWQGGSLMSYANFHCWQGGKLIPERMYQKRGHSIRRGASHERRGVSNTRCASRMREA